MKENLHFCMLPEKCAMKNWTEIEFSNRICISLLLFVHIGVFTWDINRDCDQRMHYPKGEVTRITFLYFISKQ